MPQYSAPLRDIRFVLHDLLDATGALGATGAFPDLDRALFDQVLEEAGRLCATVLQPENQQIDRLGCHLQDGGVVTPPGLKRAYEAWKTGGWSGLTARPEDGGQGLPQILSFAVNEMITSASMSIADYLGLFSMVYRMVATQAPQALRDLYLEPLASGRFGGTMAMTEPHCGTDVGLIKTRADAAEDGTWRVTGTKIFISGGDHDLTENIVHLVLCRAAGDPPGSRGLSLVLVPKILPDGTRNAVQAVRVEHKMGYAGSATCQMAFEGATGWLLGERGRGLACLFNMVNAARLIVGSQGLSTAEAAYQIAAPYALERLQGRGPGGPVRPELPADPLLCHPDVRRILLNARAVIEASRALYLWLGLEVDLLAHHPDQERRAEAEDWLSFLTATVKAVMSDYGWAATDDCLQVLGGHGYIRDNGVEQLVRDGRIARLQEGANGMLALDLIRRQIPRNEGRAWTRFLETLEAEAAAAPPALADLAQRLRQATARLAEAGTLVQARIAQDPAEAGAAGVDFQKLFGLTRYAWQWLRLAARAQAALDAGAEDDGFLAGKLHTARFFFTRVLPQAEGHWLALQAGAAPLMDPPTDYFWPAA